jgi:NRPS condensation-like uncharacterized protein
MKQRNRIEWTRLDNASKIFPATANQQDTKVFRLVCELKETIDPQRLQAALYKTLDEFPLFRTVLRKGFFWYYFESSDLMPVVEEETLPVCAPLYIKDRRNLLFRVSYYRRRINLEVFHALSDGTGALWFLKNLVCHYLVLAHPSDPSLKVPPIGLKASVSRKMDDSFGRYFTGRQALKAGLTRLSPQHAYHIRGSRNEENRLKVIEGCMSAKAVLEQAHTHNTTLTVYLAALLIYAIHRDISVQSMNRPVVLSVPINLRQFFESETTRNFFSTMIIRYAFKDGAADLADIIKAVDEAFKKELAVDRLREQLNQLMALESNPLARVVPLPIKDLSLRLAHKVSDRSITAALSNIGRISVPEGFSAYIDRFSVFTSARRPQICLCSFEDNLVVTFSSPFRETEIQRTFFSFLTGKGIECDITSNL